MQTSPANFLPALYSIHSCNKLHTIAQTGFTSCVQAGKKQLQALQDQMHEGAELTAQLQGKLAFEQTVAKVASFTLTAVAPG